MNLDSSHFNTGWWSSCWFKGESVLSFWTQTTETSLSPRWLLSKWRWCEKLVLTLPPGIVFSLTEHPPYRKHNSIPRSPPVTIHTAWKPQVFLNSCQCVCIYYTWMKSWMFQSYFLEDDPRHDYAKQTHSDHSERLPPRLGCSVLQARGRAPLEWYTEPASVVSPEVIGVNWQHRPCKANTRIVFAPLKKRLNSTFHIACQILSKLHVMMLFSFWI